MNGGLDRRGWLGPALMVPAALLLGGFLAFPLVLGVWLGFLDAKIGAPGRFIGLENFAYLLTDPVFRLTAFNTTLYTVVTVAFKLALGMALALLLNQRFAGYRVLRSVLLLPWIVPTVLSAFAWWWILDPQFSFIAGLQAIPNELHEAAAIDGAGTWRRFWHITWMLLLPLTTILATFSTIFTFTDFQLIWTITRGGPANATHLFVTLAYQRAIPGGALSEGAAIAAVTLPLLLLLSWAALRALRRPV